MHLVGRHHLVRLLGAQGLSASHVLSRPRAQWPATLARYSVEDWVASPDGRVFPAIRGGAGWSAANQMGDAYFGPINIGQTPSTIDLNTNYVYLTSGNAVAARVWLATAKTLTTVYYFVSTHTGTPDLLFEFRNEGSLKPGSTLHTSATASPGGTGWKSFTSVSFASSAGTKYWGIVADPDGATNGTATVLRNTTNASIDFNSHAGYSTANGFNTTAVASNNAGSVVFTFDDNTSAGWPVTANASPASSTNRRGWYLSTGLTETIKILGMMISNSSLTTSSGVEAYEGPTLPGGTTAASGTVATYAGSGVSGSLNGYIFDTPAQSYTVPKATPVRIVFTFSSASSSVSQLQIGAGANADLRRALWGGGNFYWGQADETGPNWNNDDIDAFPGAQLIIEDQIAGAGGGLRVHPGLTGGLTG